MSSFKNFAPLLSSLQDQADGKGTIAGSPLEDFLSIAGYGDGGGGGGTGGGLAHYTQTGQDLDCTYNDLLADIEAGRLPYISASEGNIDFGILVLLDTANDYEAWFSSTSGAIISFYNESADGYLSLGND